MDSTSLGTVDADGALAVVAEAANCQDSTPFPRSVIELLLQLIRAERAGYYEYESGVRPNTYTVEQPSIDFLRNDDAIDETAWSWPLRDHVGLQATSVRALSDSLTRTQRRRNPFHVAVSRPLGVEDEIKLWLPAPGQRVRGFLFVREPSRPDFETRERSILTLLGPHLARVRDRWEQRNRPELLTPREAEVLCLVAAGLTNRQIAKQLVLSTGTIRTHLDNIYAKLNVHTRTAAVAVIAMGATRA